MRAKHVQRIAFIVIWQATMVAAILYFDSSPRRWVPSVFAVAALLIPFVCYIAAVYDAPLFEKWSRILKAGVLTLTSVVTTIVGYCVLFLAGLLIKGEL